MGIKREKDKGEPEMRDIAKQKRESQRQGESERGRTIWGDREIEVHE